MDKQIELKNYKGEVEGVADVDMVARNIQDPAILAEFLDYNLNNYNGDFKKGLPVGRAFHNKHRTIQANLYKFCLGIICGLAEQEYTDARNENAIKACKKIKEMSENGELPYQSFI